MKYLRNNQGYALFLTILILVIFAVLSVSLTTMVFSGVDRSETREHVTQAAELSEKGIEHITAQINQDLQDMLGEHGIARTSFEGELIKILEKYGCSVQSLQSAENTSTGIYDVCIEAIEDVEGNELRKLVTFESTGTTDKQSKEMLAKVEFGAGSVPEVLKYAVGSNIRSSNPRNGEGNLLLHGGVDIFGDVKVDGNLVTYDRGTGAYTWINSIQPRMHSVIDGVKPRLVVGGNMYKMKSDPYRNVGNESTHTTYLNNTNFNTDRYTKTSNPNDLFDGDYVPNVVDREAKKDEINITDQKPEFEFRQNDTGVTRVNVGSNQRFNGYTANNQQKIVPYKEDCTLWINCSNNYNITTSFYNTNTFNYLSLLGSGHIRSGNHTFKKGLYVDKGLTIGTNSQTSRENITIDGPMYVNGNLTIQGANLTSNAMIYVDGDVNIRFSSIQGKDLGHGETGTMIVFATGDIYIANVSENQDDPTTMKGYFYSEKNIEMYGVGSNVHIDGGVAGNRVVFNALRGKVRKSRFNGHGGSVSGVGYVETVSNQRKANSRLTIKYDTELIENFLKLNPPEPVIREVDPAELIDRQ